MRITNKMMTTNCMTNINKNKVSLDKLQEQYSTGKKISRPSEDPVVAIRALKLRSNYVELSQYLEKNIPSAKSWLDTTEGALTNVDTLLTTVYEQFNQGANDTLSVADRNSIIRSLQQYVTQIYDEGNTQYAGRYVFSGFKTDTSLTFAADTTNLEYEITEKFSGADIMTSKYVVNGYSANSYDATTSVPADYETAPTTSEVYRIRLAYSDIKVDANAKTVKYMVDGKEFTADIKSTTESDCYNVANGDNAQFIPETGELVFSKEQYDAFSNASSISLTYEKNSFNKGELRPEHYFNTTVTDTSKNPTDTGYQVKYTVDDQQIQYEINFGQKLTVNTQGKDVLSHSLMREVQELAAIVDKMTALEADIAEVEKKLAEENITDAQKETLTKLKEQLDTQHTLQSKIMTERFAKGMTTTKAMKDTISTATSDLGARYSRLELTENRLETQQTELEELISSNEDADIVETVIKYSSQQTIYNAALSVASKAVKNSLLDYI